jgi:glycosyltransferase involved in cell wall biosynthesis
MRIIFVNRFFHPDVSATSQMLSELAFAQAREGLDVRVVTSRLRYDAPDELLPELETVRGVVVDRVRTTRFGRAALPGRIVDYLSFYAAASRRLSALCRPGDIVVAKTDPPLISLACQAVARRRGARFVNWVQDLYPETAEEMRVPLVRSVLGSSLRGLRNRSLAAADANVAVGEIMARRLTEGSGRPPTTHVINNWADEECVQPVPRQDNALRREWNLEGRFVVAYSGNLGRAHEYDTLLDAASLLSDEPDIAFLFIGGGRGTQGLRTEVSRRKLEHLFQFRPYQPAERLAESLSVGDVHWLSLLPQFEGLIVPSKVYGILAAGRPVIAVCDPAGELGPMVERLGCGRAVRPGDPVGLATAIRTLRDDVALRATLGAAGRRLAETSLSRQSSIAAWSRLLRSLA